MIGRMILFLVVVLGLTFAIHYFLWVRLVRDPALPEPWARILTVAIFALGALLPISMVVIRTAPRSVATPFAWVAYVWMGVMFLTFFTLVPLELARFAGHRVIGVDPERRLALARILAGLGGAAGLVLGAGGMVSALKKVAVEPVKVFLSKLPTGKSYKLVQISDVHVGPTIGKEFLESVVATINAEDADVVAITGDLVDGSVAQLGALVEPLKQIKAKHGVFFVTGNHEYYSGADEWIAHLGTLGIRVLRNERVPIDGDAGFDLAGVDDTSAKGFGHGHGQDVARAMKDRDPARAVVLLAHQPKAIGDAVKHAVDLQLSGHTHGGQIWPWGYAVRLDQRHVAGLAQEGETQIYVSRGTGYWGPPIRVGAPAEITRIEIVGTG
jgi:predicted MPP superfamily phosphohydrolase